MFGIGDDIGSMDGLDIVADFYKKYPYDDDPFLNRVHRDAINNFKGYYNLAEVRITWIGETAAGVGEIRAGAMGVVGTTEAGKERRAEAYWSLPMGTGILVYDNPAFDLTFHTEHQEEPAEEKL